MPAAAIRATPRGDRANFVMTPMRALEPRPLIREAAEAGIEPSRNTARPTARLHSPQDETWGQRRPALLRIIIVGLHPLLSVSNSTRATESFYCAVTRTAQRAGRTFLAR